MSDDKKTLKFQMMMSPAEAEELDDWMFKNRVRSRAEAIRRLCQIGIIADASPTMGLALHAVAHFIKPDKLDPESLERMKSGASLASDVKRLCWAVFEEQSKIGSFKHEGVNEAMESARRLAEMYKQAAKGTHLSGEKPSDLEE